MNNNNLVISKKIIIFVVEYINNKIYVSNPSLSVPYNYVW